MKYDIYHPESGRGLVRLVNQLTHSQVPFGFVRTPTITPEACVRIIQEERTQSIASLGIYEIDEIGMVRAAEGIPSSLPLVTAVFLNGQPCFYRYRLQHPVRMIDPNLWHPTPPMEVVGAEYRAVAVPAGQDLYYIDLYFTQPVPGAYVVYSARIGDVDAPYTREDILAAPVSRYDTLQGLIARPETDPSISVAPISPTMTKIYTTIRPVADERERKTVSWRIEVMNGYQLARSTSEQQITLLPFEQVTSEDGLQDGWAVAVDDPLSLTGSLATGEYIRVWVSDSDVEVDYHPQGQGPVRLRWRSGKKPLDLPDRFRLVNGQFIPLVGIGASDYGRPTVFISGRDLNDPWHIRVRLGREQRTVGGETYLYAMPEYWRDLFYPIAPYSQHDEVPTRINERTFRVRETPIDPGVEVKAFIRGLTDIELTVVEVDHEYGVVRTRESVPESSPLVIRYASRKDYVTYRGNPTYLNLNPRHLSILPREFGNLPIESKRLIGKTLYLYWLPYARIQNGKEMPIREETLIHTFVPLNDPTAILLAEIEVFLPYGPSSLTWLDARRRGGGLAPDADLTGKEEHVAAYADIGYYDGRPVSLAGSYVVEIAPWGTTNDPGQVKEIARRVGPFGQLPLVRTVPWPEKILLAPDGLWIDLAEVSI